MRKISAALSTIALLATLMPTTSFAAENFDDVQESHPNQEAVAYLKTQGVVQGYDDGKYLPDYTINRAEFVKIVIAATVKNPKGENCFKDITTEWFAKYICTAKEKGILKGYPDGFARPEQNINFVEGSKILVKAFALKESETKPTDAWFRQYVESLQAEKAIPVSIDYPEKKLTRGEMAEMTWRLKADIETKPTKTFSALTEELPAIGSCPELKEKFELSRYKNQRFAVRTMMLEEKSAGAFEEGESEGVADDAVAMPAEAPKTAQATEDYSKTNVQEEGVDEADVVKNDGKYIYLMKGRTIRIIEAKPATNMTELPKVEITDENFYPNEMYVTDNDLVVVGNSYSDSKSKTDVYVFDMTDRKNVVQKRNLSFEGNYVSSRRIGNKVYFVMNQSPMYWILEKEGRETEGKDLIPQFYDSKTDKEEPMAGCTTIRFFPRYEESNFLTIASIPLDNTEGVIHKQVYMGSGQTIYSSLDHLTVATNLYEYNEQIRYDILIPPVTKASTLLYRFALNDGKIEYKGNGKVPGTLLNQFSMDEEGGTFRIATTKGDFWGEESDKKPTNQLFVLDAENLNMILGKIENIGVNEKIKSVRFIGNRAYVVTFRNTDPFFVIDLSNPADPKVLGELKISGYSDYLHPYDENHILGFGKEAVAVNDNFAYYQGMKIALFDVSDVTNPKLKFQETIGDRGTNSELLYNHKALLFSKEKNLLAFPIEVAEVKNESDSDPGAYGNIVFYGAYVYRIDLENGFQLKAKISHLETQNPEEIYGSDAPLIKRLIYIGNSLYSISLKKVQAHDLASMEKQGEVTLEKGEEGGPIILY